MRDAIRRARDANRREDFYVKYAYTLTVDPEKGDLIRFGVDSEENTEIDRRDRRGLPLEAQQSVQSSKNFSTTKSSPKTTGANFSPPMRRSRTKTEMLLQRSESMWKSSQVNAKTGNILQVALIALGTSLLIALGVAIILGRRASKPLDELRKTVEAIGSGDLQARTSLHSHDEFGSVGQAINEMAEGLQERRTLLSSIERYVPYKVVDSILHSPDSPTLKGERRKLTVLVSDLRGFCKIAESRQAGGGRGFPESLL